MSSKAKEIFDGNPQLKTLYKVKGEAIYFSEKEAASAYSQSHEQALETLQRRDFFPQEATTLPEGEPEASWHKEHIKSYMEAHHIAYGEKDTKAALLEKIASKQKTKE